MAIYYDKAKDQWVARRYRKGRNHFIGTYQTEKAAREALDIFEANGYKRVASSGVRGSLNVFEHTSEGEWQERSRRSLLALSNHPYATKRQRAGGYSMPLTMFGIVVAALVALVAIFVLTLLTAHS